MRELRVLGPRALERMSKGFAGLLRLRFVLPAASLRGELLLLCSRW